MSAIAAVVHWNGRPVDRSILEAANACVRHRCPDGSWVWAEGAVGMAQADLATLPEDEPGVPIISGPLRIAASCRIDNRDELLGALPRDCIPKSNTDGAIILAAYQAWRGECVDRLIGDFAFVIWDGNKRSFFAARDICGARQLFYYRDRERFFIASDRTQILQDPTVPFEVDEEQLIEYLTPAFQFTSGWDQGLLRGFRALPAGSVLYAEQGQVIIRRYWEWHDHPPDRRPEQQVLEEYLHTLEEAVRCRLRCRTHHIAIELSGGLDSSAVVALASTSSDFLDLHTLSLIFDEVREVDDRRRIQSVLNRYPLSSHFVIADDLYGIQCFSPEWTPRTVMVPHEIMLVPAMLRMYDVAEQANCRVVLTGLMGDAVNGGYSGVYYDLLRRWRFGEILRRLRIDWNRSRSHALAGFLLNGLIPLAPWPLLRAGLGLRESMKGTNDELPDYFPDDLRRRICEADHAIRMRWVLEVQARCPVARYTLEDLVAPMVAFTMPLPQPLERRHPYTDRRLIELVLSMPQELKWEHEQRSHLRAFRLHHRKAMVGILPDEVRVGNDGVDFRPVIRRNFSPAVMSKWLLSSPVVHIFERSYVRPESFLDAIARSSEPEGYLIPMLVVEAWLRAMAPRGLMHRLTGQTMLASSI